MFGLGPIELVVISAVLLLIFGSKLPELGSGLGKAISNFKRTYKESDAIDVNDREESEDTTNSEKETK